MHLSQNFVHDLKKRFEKPFFIVPEGEISKKILPAKDLPISLLVGLFQRLQDLCEKSEGLGISAVQAGIPLSAFIATISSEKRFFLDCEYVGSGPRIQCIESCLSLPGDSSLRFFKTERYGEVFVSGYELIGVATAPELVIMSQPFFRGDAVVMQHEIDHQNSILISEIGSELSISKK